MSTDAPSAPAANPPKRAMSQAQKDAMAAGRRAANAKKNKVPEAAPAVDVSALLSRIAALEATTKKHVGISPVTVPDAVPETQAEEPKLVTKRAAEAWYEYKQKDGWKATIERGHNRIDAPDDPRWEGELAQAPFKGDAGGALVCAIVTRVDGEIVKQEPICGGPCHKNRAQEFIRRFHELKSQGSKTPWDQERHYRDKKEEMETAAREGQIEQLKLLKEMWQHAVLDRPVPTGAIS